MHSLSIVIPAYNEEAAIRQGKLKTVSDWLSTQPFDGELIVVNDESKDSTLELAEPIADRVITIPHSGKASAIMAGVESASKDIILFTDMDQATPISEATKLLKALDNSADIAIGSRGLMRQGAPIIRYILSFGQFAIRRMLLGSVIVDTQCGFKIFPRKVGKNIIRNLRVYRPISNSGIEGPSVSSGFDTEFLFVASLMGYHIKEVPVLWIYQRTYRVKLFRDGFRGLIDLFRIAYAKAVGEYTGEPIKEKKTTLDN